MHQDIKKNPIGTTVVNSHLRYSPARSGKRGEGDGGRGKGEGGRQGCKYLNFKLDLGEEG